MPPNTPCSHRVSLTDILGIIVIICLLPPRPGQVPREGITTCRARNVEVFQPVEENIDIFRLENRWISSAPTATSDPLCGPDIPFTVPHSLSLSLPFPSDAPCGVRTVLHRGACLLFAMTIPVPLSAPAKVGVPSQKPSLRPILVSAGSALLLSPLNCEFRGNLLWVFWTMNVFLVM